MLYVTKETTFDSAHYLPDYQGDCGHLHGHTYKLQITLGVDEPSFLEYDTGMIADFKDLKEIIQTRLDCLDHNCLNKIIQNPTAENLVLWIRSQIIDDLPDLYSIRLWETPTSFAEWRRV